MAGGVEVDRASMVKVATQLGQQGKPAPSWVTDDPAYLAAYDQGKAGGAAPTSTPARKAPAKRAPAKGKPATTRKPTAAPAKSAPTGAPKVQPNPGGGNNPVLDQAAPKVTDLANRAASSTGGGVLLALVLYPVFLATIQHGAAGPGMWFRAKWLNKPDGAAATTPATPAKASTAPVVSGRGIAGQRFPVTS